MASEAEIIVVLGKIAAGIQKPIAEESIPVYVEMLADLPFAAHEAAARIVLVDHVWATYPSIAEIRQAAVKVTQGHVSEMTAGEAWGIAWRIAGDTDPDVEGSFKRACEKANNGAGAPAIVLEAMRRFGMSSLFEATRRDEGTYRAQFMRIYEQLVAENRQRKLLPPKLVREIESGAASGIAALPSAAQEAIRKIGTE